MASITKNMLLDLDPQAAWAAVGDFSAPHALFAGVLTGTEVEGDDERVVTFALGMVVRERLVSRDDDRLRIAYTVVDGPFTHHHASMTIHPTDGGHCRFEWITDVLPHDVAPFVSDLMDQGLDAVAATVGGRAA